MAATREVTLLCTTLLALFAGGRGSSTCFISNSYYKVCEHGCCGNFPYEECCSDITMLIIGLVVAGIVLVCIVIAVVCFVLHQKSNNKVVRLVESAHSRGDTANITILHMSSNNPYERAPHPSSHMMSMPHGPNQPSMPPPDVPSGFHQHDRAPGFPAMPPKPPSSDADPAFPPGSRPPPGTGPGTVSSGIMAMPIPSMNGGAGMMPSFSGGPGMMTSPSGGPGMMSSPSGGPGMMPSSSGGPGMMPPSSSMNGGPLATRSVGPPVTSSSTLPALTPRKVPPLPSVPVAAGVSGEETPPPSFTAFGAPLGKAGVGHKESTSLGAAGNTANKGNNMGIEDIEDFD